MRRLNTHYTISIIALVLMAFIFIRTIQVSRMQTQLGDVQVEKFKAHVTGSYTGTTNLSVQAVGDTLIFFGPWKVTPAFVSVPFEDEQILLISLKKEVNGKWIRVEGCEILVEEEGKSVFTGMIPGGLCFAREDENLLYDLSFSLRDDTLEVVVSEDNLNLADSTQINHKYRWEKDGAS